MDKTASKTKTNWHSQLRRWYKAHGRYTLPWRLTRDPYAIWVSEVMLQQTQVATVRDRYYEPFLRRFPTLSALAASSEQEVVKAWEGLGYYSRARNLHRAAKLAGKAMPRTVEELLELPGIGRNTANAIAAFAYKIPVPVMEANVKRVIHRLYAYPTLSTDELWQKAESLLDKKNPFDYNQAMMDVGSLVCTPKNPDCPACPLTGICEGKTAPELYPAKTKKAALPERNETIVVLHSTKGRFYLEPRQSKFLGGMYSFPEMKSATLPTQKTLDIKGYKLASATLQRLGNIQHDYSHFRLKVEVWLTPPVTEKGGHWHSRKAIEGLPLSRTEKKVLALLPAL